MIKLLILIEYVNPNVWCCIAISNGGFSCHWISSCRDSAQVFATSSLNDVRVWHTETGKELLRLSVPNLTCHAVEITPNGKAIITG